MHADDGTASVQRRRRRLIEWAARALESGVKLCALDDVLGGDRMLSGLVTNTIDPVLLCVCTVEYFKRLQSPVLSRHRSYVFKSQRACSNSFPPNNGTTHNAWIRSSAVFGGLWRRLRLRLRRQSGNIAFDMWWSYGVCVLVLAHSIQNRICGE